MVVDNQNNTYYISSLYNNNPLLDGQPTTIYGTRNTILFSTDCQGNLRWSRTIGGGTSGGLTQNITLDNSGGLYITYGEVNGSSGGQYLPPRFGDNDALQVVNNPFVAQADMRYGFLLKYNTADGTLNWRRDFQGDVSVYNYSMDFSKPVIDSQNNLHIILGFQNGTHLNGMITVPSTYNTSDNYQYYLVKYDTAGNIVGTPALLPIQGSTTFTTGYLNFIYDEANDRYYLGGSRNREGTGSNGNPLSFNNVPIIESGFLLAFSSVNYNELWRREFSSAAPIGSNFIYGLKKDLLTNDIYISGKFNNIFGSVSFGTDFTFSTPLNGYIGYVMKLSTSNTTSTVLWSVIPTALSDGSTQVAIENARMPIALKGSEVLFAKGSIRETWGTFPMVRPPNDRTDPLVVKFNKDTGVVTGTHEVLGSYGGEDHFTAIATDIDGNIMLGGFISGQLFVDPNDGVPTISNVAASAKTNFFYTKLATSAQCTQLATEEISVKETDLQFYPNPVDDVLNIKTKESLKTYEVISAVGQQVKRGSFKANDFTINMQGLTKGVYFVKVFTDKISVVEKVVKK